MLILIILYIFYAKIFLFNLKMIEKKIKNYSFIWNLFDQNKVFRIVNMNLSKRKTTIILF